MKKIFTKFIRSLISLAFIMLLASTVFAQIPAKMSYQAVVRDAANKLVVSKSVGIQINILQGSITGAVVYTETQKATTNINGLITLEIGGGAGFETIDWTAGPFFIQTKIDPTGGTNYTITGTSQILSVPFALAAGTAFKLTGPLNEKDPVFTAWDKSTGILIKQKQITDLKLFTTADETDPIFKAWNKSDGISITESQITNLKHFTNANEIDPIFSAWNKSTGILIKQNQITDLKLFTTADETDPIFKKWDKSTGIVIKESQISDLKHFTTADEKDPIFKASVASKITKEDTVRWNQDTDPENEIQYLYKTQHRISLTDGGFITTDLMDAYYNGDSITTFRGPVVINASTGGGAIKLMDNNQGNNKVLISDAQGVGRWDSVATQNIKNYTIIDQDVSHTAEIQVHKLHEGAPGSILGSLGTSPVWTAAYGDVLIKINPAGDAVTEIQADSVTASEINPDVAGAGIIQEVSGALGVNPDNHTLEVALDTVKVKDYGITTIKLAPNAVDSTKIQTGAVLSSEIRDNTIMDVDINANAEIAVSKLGNGSDGQMILTDGTDVYWQDMSGDVIIGNNGVTTITDNAVQESDLDITNTYSAGDVLIPGGTDQFTWTPEVYLADSAYIKSNIRSLIADSLFQAGEIDALQLDSAFQAGEIDALQLDSAYQKSQIDDIITLPQGYIYVGDASNKISEVQMTGDVIMDETGVTTITDNAVQESDLDITNTYTAGDFLSYAGSDQFVWSPEVDPIYSADSAYIKGNIRSLIADSLFQAGEIADNAQGIIDSAAAIRGDLGTLAGLNVADLTTDVTGVLPIANGGTNSGIALNGSSIMISDGSRVVQGSAGVSTMVLHGNDAGAPTYSAVDLAADVTGTLPNAHTTASVGNAANTLVVRDAVGDFSAGMISANLTGSVTGNVSGTAANVTGTVAVANGGTGLVAAGALGNVLTSDGSVWTSAAPASSNSVTDATNATLTRSGAGPYTLELNVGNANTWTAVQTFPAAADANGTAQGNAFIASINRGGNAITDVQIANNLTIVAGTVNNTVIGGSTPAAGHFTTLSATGQITSTVATGTAPLVIASTTPVANLSIGGNAATATVAHGLLYGVDAANAVAYVDATVPAPTVAGQVVLLKASIANSGAAASFNGISIVKGNGALLAGDIIIGVTMLVYDGTNYIIVGK